MSILKCCIFRTLICIELLLIFHVVVSILRWKYVACSLLFLHISFPSLWSRPTMGFFLFFFTKMFVTKFATYILAFGPHPDDVEIGAWWVLAQTSSQWKRNVIVDLTSSQLSTHGDVVTRIYESHQAADVLWVIERVNLWLSDGFLSADDSTVQRIVTLIRQYQPEIVMFPYHADRHPDHEATYQIVKKALFFAGLAKYGWADLPTHKPRLSLCYQIWHELTPDVTIALSDEIFAKKMQAFQSYVSQEPTNEWGIEYITARHITQWRRIGVRYGEWFMLPCHGLGITDLDGLISGCF